MAYFAQINDTNTVTEVIAVSNEIVGDFPASEPIGQAFIANDLGLSGVWLQTSFNGSFRAYYAGIGYTYDAQSDEFVPPPIPPLPPEPTK